MSLTILIQNERSSVGIVRWFLDPKVSVSYATGPLIELSWARFRAEGWQFVQSHFEEFSKRRLTEERATQVFSAANEKEYLRRRYAVRIRLEDSGEKITLIPQVFSTHTLAGLSSLGKETRHTIRLNSPPQAFWRTFDEVLANARNSH